MSANQLMMRRAHLDDLPPMPPIPEGLELAEASSRDAVGLARLLTAAFKDPTWNITRVNEKLLDAPDVLNTFIIKSGARIIATASAREVPDRFLGSGYVHWVAADPASSGQRLGSIVSLAVLNRFAELGMTDAVLETDDFRLSAIKTYLKLGFQPYIRYENQNERWELVMANLFPNSPS